MRGQVMRLMKWLRALMRGARLERALERHRQAAEELDKAVREVLGA